MEGILVTMLILAVSAIATILTVKFHGSRVRHANIQYQDTVQRHRRLTRQYREEQSRLGE